MIILDGKSLAIKVKEALKEETATLFSNTNKKPGIVVILVGEDPASQVYVASKEKSALEIGYHSIANRVPADITTEALIELIDKYNADDSIHGILVQLPLPKHIDEKQVLRRIKPEKDVDGFHPFNVGLLNIGEDCLLPCTPAGIMEIFKEYNIDLTSKSAVVIGRSNIVGKPIAALLTKANATVTITHSKTLNLAEVCSKADIIVAAIGKPKFLTENFVKDGAIIIDVGINRVDGKLCGDVDFESVKHKASYITPVPGGVGPMTIAMLMKNTLKAFKLINNIK